MAAPRPIGQPSSDRQVRQRVTAGFSHRRKQAVLGFRLAQHRLFRPVRNQPIRNREDAFPESLTRSTMNGML